MVGLVTGGRKVGRGRGVAPGVGPADVGLACGVGRTGGGARLGDGEGAGVATAVALAPGVGLGSGVGVGGVPPGSGPRLGGDPIVSIRARIHAVSVTGPSGFAPRRGMNSAAPGVSSRMRVPEASTSIAPAPSRISVASLMSPPSGR